MRILKGSVLFASGIFLVGLALGCFVDSGVPQQETRKLIALLALLALLLSLMLGPLFLTITDDLIKRK